MMSIQIRRVSKRFGNFLALQNIDLEISDGQLVALLGPSGSGKTTLLRIIAGLERPDEGPFFLTGKTLPMFMSGTEKSALFFSITPCSSI